MARKQHQKRIYNGPFLDEQDHIFCRQLNCLHWSWLTIGSGLRGSVSTGVAVPGGRAGTVGVAGLILGGGDSFFSVRAGLYAIMSRTSRFASLRVPEDCF